MPTIDESLIAYAVSGHLTELQQAGISSDSFVDEFSTIWSWIVRQKGEHDVVVSRDLLEQRYPDLELPRRVTRGDVQVLLDTVKKRLTYKGFITALTTAVSSCTDFERVQDTMQELQGELNRLSGISGTNAHLVSLFERETTDKIVEAIRERKAGHLPGIPTGLPTLDRVTGGLRKQEMAVIIGRTGFGKSWINLLFVASAVINGKKVILYPLEMTITEVAMRLYTIFTSQLWGHNRALRNMDLTDGSANIRRVQRFLNALEDKFSGQLYVADVGSLADPYTVERIEAEVEMHHPDLFWVDYLTLLKPPSGAKDSQGWEQVRYLSHGIKNIAMRRNAVGGCSAQVNREAVQGKALIPRLEHISYGDSIGQDADKVLSIGRRQDHLYYGLVKNRGGPEIAKVKMRFNPDIGDLTETGDVDEEE